MTRIGLFAAGVSLAATCGAQPAADPQAELLLSTMQQELTRAQNTLGKLDPPPYFISYAVFDQQTVAVNAEEGAIVNSISSHQRRADVTMHVGTAALDNTHDQGRESGINSLPLPLGNDRDAIARSLWLLTYNEYRQASGAYLQVKTQKAVQSEEEDKSADFSTETSHQTVLPPGPPAAIHQKEWEDQVRAYSAELKKYPFIYNSVASLTFEQGTEYMVSTDGTKLSEPGHQARLVIEAETRADDGMDLLRVETFQASTPEQLPPMKEVSAKIEKMATDLKALRAAPVADPYDGPALLSGRATAVFFHEVLGHRLEGHRQRGEEEGQTFTKKVNESVLPSFLSVADDPTMKKLNGVDLAGTYEFDDEGTPAERVEVIQNGILKSFLMSRIPIANFSHSNGHGRRQAGRMATGRQGNLIVTSTNTLPESDLRKRFIEEIKKQGKPYGLYFEDVEGGFTLTQRELPQAFQVLPIIVWRVYPDGRPDELVRGVDIVGTPLSALERILVTGDKMEVFNGVCGAESGFVPVSAAAPAMLFSEMEVQKSSHGRDRPPILPPPGSSTTGSGSGSAGGTR
ncbi:MAG TPA: metallopeptidase TldD-related protein [Candidatus Acidoferrales bacterium]|jgi:predicted Zn-dependent protease|nr:metallopeptidase TldD-related protein [Candidatus Acidoferrales bacterium]